mmetsp:Transcript_40540/g.114672  ORF Transcript_40540/g.114672 Transcript_40540/m.114672 type:complete len:255 (-) Transcript_40540:37-801(-)
MVRGGDQDDPEPPRQRSGPGREGRAVQCLQLRSQSHQGHLQQRQAAGGQLHPRADPGMQLLAVVLHVPLVASGRCQDGGSCCHFPRVQSHRLAAENEGHIARREPDAGADRRTRVGRGGAEQALRAGAMHRALAPADHPLRVRPRFALGRARRSHRGAARAAHAFQGLHRPVQRDATAGGARFKTGVVASRRALRTRLVHGLRPALGRAPGRRGRGPRDRHKVHPPRVGHGGDVQAAARGGLLPGGGRGEARRG